jgi:hypothetical protein
MCCLFTILLLLGPRVANVIWWIFDTARWSSAFGSIIWPILGIIFLPWTTLVYVLVTPNGLGGLDIILLFAAIAADVLSYAGGGFGNRKRVLG